MDTGTMRRLCLWADRVWTATEWNHQDVRAEISTATLSYPRLQWAPPVWLWRTTFHLPDCDMKPLKARSARTAPTETLPEAVAAVTDRQEEAMDHQEAATDLLVAAHMDPGRGGGTEASSLLRLGGEEAEEAMAGLRLLA